MAQQEGTRLSRALPALAQLRGGACGFQELIILRKFQFHCLQSVFRSQCSKQFKKRLVAAGLQAPCCALALLPPQGVSVLRCPSPTAGGSRSHAQEAGRGEAL